MLQDIMEYTGPDDLWPNKPGIFWGREIFLSLGQKILVGAPHRIEVVEGVPNPRGHRLLARTGGTNPKYRALSCYKWGSPTKAENEMRSAFLFNLGWESSSDDPRRRAL